MAIRSFFAQDNENLVIAPGSPSGTPGSPIINNSSMPNGTQFVYTSGSGAWITLDDTSGGRNVFNDDQSGSHTITDGGGLVADGNGVEAESIIELQALDGNGNPTGPVISITVFSQNGSTGNVWGFASDTPLEDGVTYEKIDGSNTGNSRYADFITCFAADTMIATPDGEIAVQDIEVGQPIWTLDNGIQPVRWVATTTVQGIGAFAPVHIEANALGNAEPLTVSQQHRMCIQNYASQLLFGSDNVLVAAKHLVGMPGVSIAPRQSISYTHFMFNQHQIVRSNGMLSESFFLADNSLNGVDWPARAELLALFPSLATGIDDFGDTAAMTIKGWEARLLAATMREAA